MITASIDQLDIDRGLETLAGSITCFPFQAPFWLESWYATMAPPDTVSRFIVTVRDGAGQRLLAIPLLLRDIDGLRQIEMPDGGASDYLAPLFFARDLPEPEAIWDAILKVLPEADLLSFTGLRAEVDGIANPLARHSLVQPSRIRGSEVRFTGKWEDYFSSLSSRTRQDINRWRRRFLEQPGARFAVAEDAETASRWLAQLDAMQAERLDEKGIETSITNPEFANFYKVAAARGIASGDVLMAGLFAGEETIALGYAVRAGERAVYVRVASQRGNWSPMRPGILVGECMMKHALQQGVRVFDFGLGEYEYKRRFGAVPFELVDLDLPLSAKGRVVAYWRYMRRHLRKNKLLRRITGRKPLEKPVMANAS